MAGTNSLDLATLMQNVSAYKAGSEAGASAVADIRKQQAQLALDNSAVQTQVGADNQVITAAKSAAELQTQARIAKVADVFGTDIDATNNQLVGLAAASQQAYQEKISALEEINRKRSTTLFDNPIEYLINQFTINDDINKHNAADALLDASQSRIRELNAETQTTAQTQKMLETPLTVAAAEAATRNAAAEATIAANKSKQESFNYNVDGINNALSASKDVLGLQFSALGAQNAQKNIELSMAHLALAQDAAKERIREFNLREDDRKETAEAGIGFIKSINQGRLARGAAVLDDASARQVLAAMKGKGILSDTMKSDYARGEATSIAGVPIIATSPARLLDDVTAGIPIKLTPAQEPLKKVILNARDTVADAIGNPTKYQGTPLANINPKDKASIDSAVNRLVQTTIDQQAKVIKPGDADNINQIASINTLAAASPTIQQLPVYQKVFAPLVATGVQLDDPNKIVHLVADATAKGTITHAQALELTTIFHVGVATNIASRNITGVAGLTPSRSYRAEVGVSSTNPNDSFGGGTTVYDLTKPDAVSKALLKINTAKISSAYAASGRLID